MVQPVLAQDGGRVVLTPPDTTQFPAVGFFMEAYDSQGHFLSNLAASDMQVLENGKARPVSALTAFQPGLQITVALNTAPIMSNMSGKDTLYKKIQTALVDWASRQPADSPDDFTLLSNDGVRSIHQTGPKNWAAEISSYQPDLTKSKPSLSSISQALDIATDPNLREQMKRVILYVTPLPAENNLGALPNLADRSAQMGERVFVWLVGNPGAEKTKAGEALSQLAGRTGGGLFLLTGNETLPDLETYFQPLRTLYQVSYTSGATKSGLQRLVVQVKTSGDRVISPEQDFTLEVQPPNPIFLAPPSQIERKLSSNGSAKAQSLQPESASLKILIEFPDGHKRPIQRSVLYVNQKAVVENTRAPFDQFEWNLAEYQTSQKLALRVEVQDSLGLTQSSIETPVDLVVEQPKQLWIKEQISPRRLMIGGSVLVAGIALCMVLWISGRRGWLSSSERRRKARLMKDPVTQPVKIQQDQPRKTISAALEHPSWPRTSSTRKSPAWLQRVDANFRPLSGATIPLNRREITIGSNPQMATCVLNHLSIDGLHARLTVKGDTFILSDAGSIAGTWVNYNLVSAAGTKLEHGDLVHFGQLAFRFELANPAHIRQPKVTEYKEPL